MKAKQVKSHARRVSARGKFFYRAMLRSAQYCYASRLL